MTYLNVTYLMELSSLTVMSRLLALTLSRDLPTSFLFLELNSSGVHGPCQDVELLNTSQSKYDARIGANGDPIVIYLCLFSNFREAKVCP